MLQDFSAGYYLLNAEVYTGSYQRPEMYVDEVYEMRESVGVDRIVGKMGNSHFEIRPSGSVADRSLVLPEELYEAVETKPGRNRVLIAKESALDVLNWTGVLPREGDE